MASPIQTPWFEKRGALQGDADVIRGNPADAPSPVSGLGFIWYDVALSRWRASENGGAAIDLLGGAGDVFGPASATDNAICRFDLATGKLIQNSGATIDDSSNLTAASLRSTTFLQAGEIATPATPASGFGRIYFKSDGKVYALNDGGVETDLQASGGGTITGGGAATQLAVFSAASAIAGSAELVYDTAFAGGFLSLSRSANDLVGIIATNADAGGAAQATVFASNGSFSSSMTQTGTGFTPVGLKLANQLVFESDGGNTGGTLFLGSSSADVVFTQNGSATANQKLRFSSTITSLYDPAASGIVGLSVIGGGALEVPEIAAPGTPASGFGRIYEKTDGLLYFKNDGGTEYDLTATGGGGMSIGGTVTSGVANRILFVGAGPVLAQDAGFTWDGTTFGANGAASFNASMADRDFTVASDTQANALFLDASLDSGFGRWGMFTASPTAKLHVNNGTSTDAIFKADDNGTTRFAINDPAANNLVEITAGTLASDLRAFSLTATMPSGDGAGFQIGNLISVTGNGTAAATQDAIRVQLNAGYTGSFTTRAGGFFNNSAGTAGAGHGTNWGDGNIAVDGQATPTTTGTNFGVRGRSGNGDINVGSWGSSEDGDKNGATSVGVVGSARNNGSTPVRVGGHFFLSDSSVTFDGFPVFIQSALVADNGPVAAPIFLGRDNNVTVFALNDGMNSVAFGTGFDRTASGTYAIGGTNITTLTLGRTGQTVALAGGSSFAEGITFADAVNIAVNATTGTKIGTATTQKLGFFNAAPVVQQASVADATGGVVIDAEARAAINAVISNLEALGLQATV